jgi:hypothetical protein
MPPFPIILRNGEEFGIILQAWRTQFEVIETQTGEVFTFKSKLGCNVQFRVSQSTSYRVSSFSFWSPSSKSHKGLTSFEEVSEALELSN